MLSWNRCVCFLRGAKVTVDEIFGPISVDRVAVRPDKTPEEEKVS